MDAVQAPPASDLDEATPSEATVRERRSSGPLDTIHVFWLAGMSCDGCSIAVTGATNPGIEGLLAGTVPAMPQMILHHPVLAVEAGEAFMANHHKAWRGELDAPYVVVLEGSVADERIAARTGGYWSAMGVEIREGFDDPQPVPTAEWIQRLAPGAAAVIAIGTCATWGGIPAAEGNPTAAMGLMEFLGKDFRSAFGLPVINVPGCAPVGDNFTETVFAVLLFLQGLGPLPTFDELGRPSWLFGETVHRGCSRAGFYEEGVFAHEYGRPECLVELGCWGPVVNCNIVRRGAINHMGGCMEAGGVCIGCTMPSFPDKFSPFYKRSPGSTFSSYASRTHGSVIRRLRRLTNRALNTKGRWHVGGADAPSGWGHVRAPSVLDRVEEFFYERLQFMGAKRPGRPKGQARRYWGGDRPGTYEDYGDRSEAGATSKGGTR
jgi:hydrogenase small subunit